MTHVKQDPAPVSSHHRHWDILDLSLTIFSLRYTEDILIRYTFHPKGLTSCLAVMQTAPEPDG